MEDTDETIIDEEKNNTPNVLEALKGKKPHKMIISIYGDSFTGFQKLTEIKHLLPAFKAYYYEERIKDKNISLSKIAQGFNKLIAPEKFHPFQTNVKHWREKWDADILANQHNAVIANPMDNIEKIVKTRDDENNLISPAHETLEQGIQTLGGELLNDAYKMLKEDQNKERWQMDDEVIVKRRNYIVGVFGHVTKLVHGKAALLLKASEEKRNNAGFLMDLLAKATSGKLSEADMDLLKSNYQPKEVEVTNV
jgi:hypothetical protein